MEIKLITSNKKQFLDLLLLADEQESTNYIKKCEKKVKISEDGLF